MRHILAALAALLLLAAPAPAATFNVTNDASLNSAMTTCSAGDLINIGPGTYTGTFVPSASGSAGSPIRIVGSQATPSTRVRSGGISWSGTRSYISWTGINFTDDVQFTRADHCSLTYCKVDSGGLVSYGSNSDPTSVGISENNYIGDCTFRQNIGSNSFALVFKRTESTTVQRCRFFQTITNAAADGRGRYLYRSSNNNFTDTYFAIECWGAENGEQFAQGIRDSSRFNTFTRDSMWIGMTSKRSRRALMSQSGTFAGTATPNYWINCDYRSFHEPATDNAFEWQDGTGGLCQNTVFVSRIGRALTFPGSATTPGLVLRHVTAYSSDRQAFRYGPTTNPTGSRFNGCAFISRVSPGSCASDGGALFMLQTLGSFASSDSNAFLCADTSYAFTKAGGGLLCYTPAAWRTATSNDLASRSFVLASGTVTDTTWATLDLRPPTGSPLLSASLFPSGFAGAYDAAAAEEVAADAGGGRSPAVSIRSSTSTPFGMQGVGWGVVVTPTSVGNDQRGYTNYMRQIRNALDAAGAKYDVMRADALTLAQLSAGSVTAGPITRTYDWAIVTNFTRSTTTYPLPGLEPDLLTLRANWPSIPTLLVSSYYVVNAAFQNSASCSLGVTSATSANFSTFPGNGRGFFRTVYATGYAEPWKTYDGMLPLAVTPGTQSNGAILRPLVQSSMSAASWINSTSGDSVCVDCDSTARSASDSTTLFRLSRATASGAETGAPIFFVSPTMNGQNGGANFSSGLMSMAIAALDSATRLTSNDGKPKVIGQAPKWEVRKLAIVLTHAGGHSSGAAESFDGESGGVMSQGSAWTDSATFKATYRDSLGSLGIPINVAYNADRDTVAAYPNELAFYKTLPLAKFTPTLTRGLFSQASTSLNQLLRPTDVWGRVRTRSLYASDCTSDTLSLYCGLSRIKAYSDSLFPGRTVRTIYAPTWDWIPANYNRAFLPTRDSLVTVAILAGFNSLIVSPENTEQSPGASYNLQSGGGSVYATSATDVRGLFNNDQRVAAYSDFARTIYAGTFNFPASRGRWGEANTVSIRGNAGHFWSEEFLWGAMSTTGPWYPVDYPYYYHNFKTRLSVMEVPVNLLHGKLGLRQGPNRYGWWHIKYTVNQAKAINRLAGRTVVQFVYADEL